MTPDEIIVIDNDSEVGLPASEFPVIEKEEPSGDPDIPEETSEQICSRCQEILSKRGIRIAIGEEVAERKIQSERVVLPTGSRGVFYS